MYLSSKVSSSVFMRQCRSVFIWFLVVKCSATGYIIWFLMMINLCGFESSENFRFCNVDRLTWEHGFYVRLYTLFQLQSAGVVRTRVWPGGSLTSDAVRIFDKVYVYHMNARLSTQTKRCDFLQIVRYVVLNTAFRKFHLQVKWFSPDCAICSFNMQ